MSRLVQILIFCLAVSCRYEGSRLPATDSASAMNGTWDLVGVECGSAPSVAWKHAMEVQPVNARKHVNNGQTIDYVVNSANCLQTTTGHLVSTGPFLFSQFRYKKYCHESCGNQIKDCGDVDTETKARIEVLGDEMLISENDTGICRRGGQDGPMTLRYKKLAK